MFGAKLIELTDSISDDLRHEKLKDLQTWYVAAYMKIMLKIKSAENYCCMKGTCMWILCRIFVMRLLVGLLT